MEQRDELLGSSSERTVGLGRKPDASLGLDSNSLKPLDTVVQHGALRMPSNTSSLSRISAKGSGSKIVFKTADAELEARVTARQSRQLAVRKSMASTKETTVPIERWGSSEISNIPEASIVRFQRRGGGRGSAQNLRHSLLLRQAESDRPNSYSSAISPPFGEDSDLEEGYYSSPDVYTTAVHVPKKLSFRKTGQRTHRALPITYSSSSPHSVAVKAEVENLTTGAKFSLGGGFIRRKGGKE